MVFGVGDTVSVVNTVGDINDNDALGIMGYWAKAQAQRQEELDISMLVYAGLAIAQMIIYWNMVDKHTDARDCAIGKYQENNMGMLGFLWELENYRDNVDYPILLRKAAIKDEINFDEWAPNSCKTATLYVDKLKQDANVLDRFENMFADCSCSGIPEGWSIHDGSLSLGLGASYAGPIMNVAAIEMFEVFKTHAVAVVQKAQMSMKAIYNISGIMKYYEQVIGIHENLASMYIQGFNSAGAMLGTALGKLASAGGGSGTVVNTKGIGGVQNAAPITVGWTSGGG